MRKLSKFNIFTLIFAAFFFIAPLLGAFGYALRGVNGAGHSLVNFRWIFQQQGFYTNLGVSLRLAAVTALLVMFLMVPTVVFLHLGGKRWRRLIEFVCLVPIVVPVVSLAIGAQISMPKWLQSTPYELCFFYVIVSMPYVYRAVDIGLQSISLSTLVEASQSLGASGLTTLRLVIVPAIRSAVTGALFISIALSLGEYALASLLHFNTFPTWVTNVSQENILGSIALSVSTLIGAWVVLLLIVFLPKIRSLRKVSVNV